MSELMTKAVIEMPFDMAMGDELSRLQFHGRAQALLTDYARLEQECELLRGLLMEAKAALDPFDEKILEARINAALSAKP